MLVEGGLDYLFHVDALRPDDPARHLKLLLIFDLDVVPAGQLAVLRVDVGRVDVFFVAVLLQGLGNEGPFDLGVVRGEHVRNIVVILSRTPVDHQF